MDRITSIKKKYEYKAISEKFAFMFFMSANAKLQVNYSTNCYIPSALKEYSGVKSTLFYYKMVISANFH